MRKAEPEVASLKDPSDPVVFDRRSFLWMMAVSAVGLVACTFPRTPPTPSTTTPEEVKRYLYLPFRMADLLDGKYEITEGWIYDKERVITNQQPDTHNGVDVHVPFGTPLIAPCDGYVMCSYQTLPMIDPETREQRMYEGKPLNYGLGYFIQFYNPGVNRFVQLGHLSAVDESIPFSPPIQSAENVWTPQNHNLPIEKLMHHPMVREIKRGDPVGRVGFSGLITGNYREYQTGAQRPLILNPDIQRSWDEPHVHIEDFDRDQSIGANGAKIDNRDPWDLYAKADRYPTPDNRLPLGRNHLFVVLENGLPAFAA